MKIRTITEFRNASDVVCVNAVALTEKKVSSQRLEQGKALQVCVERHPEIKTVAKAFRACGGIGNPAAHAMMTRNVFLGFVVSGPLTEDAYDASNLNDHKQASPIANLLEKHKDKFPNGFDAQVRSQVAMIMTEKPEDSGKELKAIRKQVEELAGVNPDKSALEKLEKALEDILPELTESEAEAAYQLLFSAAQKVTEIPTTDAATDVPAAAAA